MRANIIASVAFGLGILALALWLTPTDMFNGSIFKFLTLYWVFPTVVGLVASCWGDG